MGMCNSSEFELHVLIDAQCHGYLLEVCASGRETESLYQRRLRLHGCAFPCLCFRWNIFHLTLTEYQASILLN